MNINEPVIIAENVSKQFDELWAVRDFSLAVYAGEVVALLGPNGAGKTTTVRVLSSILRPSTGRAWVAGLDVVQHARIVRSQVGLLTELPGLYKRMVAVEYLDFFGRLHNMPASKRRERIEELLRRFGLWDVRQIQISHYSKGMAQKLAIIRTILHDPLVLFLDEPTSAMDPQSAQMVREMICQLRNEGKTIVVCTHNLAEAQELASRMVIMHQGQIAAEGTLEQLRARYLNETFCEVRVAEHASDLPALLSPVVTVESHGEGWLRYRTSDVRQTNPRVLELLVQAGVHVLTLSTIEHSLQDIYLSLIEDERAST